jgi:hypothetical protein
VTYVLRTLRNRTCGEQHTQHTPGDLYENKRPKFAECRQITFRTSRTAGSFCGRSAGRYGHSWEWAGGRPEHQGEKINSHSTSIPPSIYMKTNDGNSPNPGDLHFEPPKPRDTFRRKCRPWHSHSWRCLSPRGKALKEENPNSHRTSIPPSIYMKINDGNSPNPGDLHFILPEPQALVGMGWRTDRATAPGYPGRSI